MIPTPLLSLARALGGRVHPAPQPVTVTGVSTDSRSLRPGDLYVAIRGPHFDGHDFVPATLRDGAAACLVDPRFAARAPADLGPLLIVDDTVAALGRWARWTRRRSGYTVLGITGSAGKTTTRHLTAQVLHGQRRVWQSPRNFNNLIGLPLTLLQAPPDTEVVVAELGTNQPGEIAALTRIAEPDIAVVTLAAPAHLAGFGSLEGVIREKLAITEGLPDAAPLVFNGDCAPLRAPCRHLQRPTIAYGRGADLDLRADALHHDARGSNFHVDTVPVRLNLPGPAQVGNALAAWALCRHLGLAPEVIAAGLAAAAPTTMRGERLDLGSLTVLNDCYNANPASMAHALETLALLGAERPGSRRVFVCGTMGELGPDAERLHRKLGPAIAAAGVDLVLALGPLPTHAAESAQTLRPELRISRYDRRDEMVSSLAAVIQEGDILLVKGSRSAGLETVVEALRDQATAATDLP